MEDIEELKNDHERLEIKGDTLDNFKPENFQQELTSYLKISTNQEPSIN